MFQADRKKIPTPAGQENFRSLWVGLGHLSPGEDTDVDSIFFGLILHAGPCFQILVVRLFSFPLAPIQTFKKLEKGISSCNPKTKLAT